MWTYTRSPCCHFGLRLCESTLFSIWATFSCFNLSGLIIYLPLFSLFPAWFIRTIHCFLWAQPPKSRSESCYLMPKQTFFRRMAWSWALTPGPQMTWWWPTRTAQRFTTLHRGFSELDVVSRPPLQFTVTLLMLLERWWSFSSGAELIVTSAVSLTPLINDVDLLEAAVELEWLQMQKSRHRSWPPTWNCMSSTPAGPLWWPWWRDNSNKCCSGELKKNNVGFTLMSFNSFIHSYCW